MGILNPFLKIALQCIARRWYVFPCIPESKRPLSGLVPHGWHDASNDEATIRRWWTAKPDANVAIACKQSNLCVLDVDDGLQEDEQALMWVAKSGLPNTYSVRTGRRPGIGLQFYFQGAISDVGLFELNGCTGQVKSLGGYVMAAGSIHPDTKQPYTVKNDAPLASTPDVVRALQTRTKKVSTEPGRKIPEGAGRHDALMRVACSLRARGLDGDTIYASMIPVNESMCEVPIDDEDLQTMCYGIEKRYGVPEPDPVVVLGGVRETAIGPNDWRKLFHTREEALHAPPITFLIKGFLQREGVTAIAGPVRERKSLIALNVAHALLTGEKLFDHFEVVKKPDRVLYLCPEVSLGPFTDRLKKIGLLDLVGGALFYRTLSADGALKLDDPALKTALPGSVVILDTAVRFFEGDENSSRDARAFADSIFALLRAGAESIVMLHHSPKGNGDGMTLENAMRGSGDFGAFLACCWGTKLQDPTKPYESPSYLENLKQRDFESRPFEVTGGPDCRLHVVGNPETRIVKLQGRKTFKGNKDGKDDVALAIVKANPKMSGVKTAQLLREQGIERSSEWVRKRRFELLQESGGLMP